MTDNSRYIIKYIAVIWQSISSCHVIKKCRIMSNTIKNIFVFSIGAAIGSFITWRFTKTMYKRIAQEEIDSVKEIYSKKSEKDEGEDKEIYSNKSEKDEDEDIDNVEKVKCDDRFSYENYRTSSEEITKYDEILNKNGYKKGGSEETGNYGRPYYISPEEFAEDDEYEVISLRYYADDVLTDEVDDVIYDWENTVGEDFSDHFGEYEEDSVFVKNDRLKCYYEILRDEDNYPGPSSKVNE